MIDLRSDFLSSPTPAMLDAMRGATDQDKGYGPRDDPQQRLLERTAAEMLGKDDALFVPTCMMANLLAVMAVAKRGEAVVLDSDSHVLNGESGALAAIAGVVTRPLSASRGRIPLDLLGTSLQSGTLQQPRTAVVMLENSHNKAGGRSALTTTPMCAVASASTGCTSMGLGFSMRPSRWPSRPPLWSGLPTASLSA